MGTALPLPFRSRRNGATYLLVSEHLHVVLHLPTGGAMAAISGMHVKRYSKAPAGATCGHWCGQPSHRSKS